MTGSRSANSPPPPGRFPLTLGAGEGLEAVCAAANRAGITISGLTISGLTISGLTISGLAISGLT